MKINTIIIDDFLDNPDIVRNSVLEIDISKKGMYPGYRSDRADEDYADHIQQKIESILNKRILGWEQDSLQFQLCLEDEKTWLHCDETDWAGILYLTPGAPVNAGTGIFRHISTQTYIGPNTDINAKDETQWELITTIGNVYNRLVLYNGKMFHRSLISGFGASKETGRLTQVFFFNTSSDK
jgi:hypothetical protein